MDSAVIEFREISLKLMPIFSEIACFKVTQYISQLVFDAASNGVISADETMVNEVSKIISVDNVGCIDGVFLILVGSNVGETVGALDTGVGIRVGGIV